MSYITYKPEINGLRAVAVLSVIIFHAGIEQLAGGFVGVDIFYVISGYLITNIIMTSLEKKEFKLHKFYSRRVKRLFPAALTMIIATLFVGFIMLTPDKYIDLTASAGHASLFIANVFFMINSGYFDQETAISPLAHMWSLSVEEQFYLIFPILVILAFRLKGKIGVQLLLVSLFSCSLVACILLSETHPHFSFYMLPTRAWELILGGLLIFIPAIKKQQQQYLYTYVSVLGASLIIFSIIFITEYHPFPSYWALFPALGTALIIYATSSQKNIINTFLNNALFMFIGKISYSAYLWHWPIIVFYRTYINRRDFTLLESMSLILLSLIVGYLSWYFIEEKCRYAKTKPSRTIVMGALTSFSLCIVSLTIFAFGGFPNRISTEGQSVQDRELMQSWKCNEYIQISENIERSFCVIGASWEESSKKGIVWGDSHSFHWAQILNKVASDAGMSFVIAPRVLPYINSEYAKEYDPQAPNITELSTKSNKAAINFVNNNDDIQLVIMSAAWSGHIRLIYSDKNMTNKGSTTPFIERTGDAGVEISEFALNKLVAQMPDKKILLFADFPRPNRVLNGCAFSAIGNLPREKCSNDIYKTLNANSIFDWHKYSDGVLRNVASNFKHVDAFFPSDKLCNEISCLTHINEELIYRDGNHIRLNLSNKTISQLIELFRLEEYIPPKPTKENLG